MKDFIILSDEEKSKLTNEELIIYYKKLKDFYLLKKHKISINKFQNFIHPVLLKSVKLLRKFDIKIIGKNTIPKEEPLIFALNHSNSHDFPTASEVVKEHCYLLAGKENLNLITKILFYLNGVIFVRRKDKQNRSQAKTKLIDHLYKGDNVLIFPEGTWNLSENKIMLPLNWGIIDVSIKTGVPIIPIIMEYTDDGCYVNIGEKFIPNLSETKKEQIGQLSDIMASLRWEIWEQLPTIDDSKKQKDQYKKNIDKVLKEYPKLDYSFEQTIIRKTADNYDEVFDHLKHLSYTKNNAFLLGKYNH
ncbi:MAG: lysophospholipid acyltransferase family protein [Bacilli bacterium]